MNNKIKDKEMLKEISRKKKNNFIKKVKKLYNKFFGNLSKTTKYIILVWVIVLLVVLGMGLLVSLSDKNMEKYEKLEKAMYDGTLDYVTEFSITPTKAEKSNIPLDVLVSEQYVYKSDVPDDNCHGGVIYYYEDDHYVIETFLSCDHYTGKYYGDYLDYINNIKK